MKKQGLLEKLFGYACRVCGGGACRGQPFGGGEGIRRQGH